MRKLLLLIFAAFTVQTFCLTQHVYSQEFNYALSGIIYEQPSYFNIKSDSLLNPDNEILDFSEWTNRLYGRIALNIYYGNIKLISQTRPVYTVEEKESDEFKLITDDAYLDISIGEGYFLFIGKRNLRDVVAYGVNPTDFLGENKEVDFTKREEERRVERKGNYIIGGEAFFNNVTLSVAYAPELDEWQDENDRVLVRGNYFAESINTDMSLHLYHGDIPGIGFDISSTVSDNLVLHVESAFREGSEQKKTITILNQGGGMIPRTYQITGFEDDDKIYPHIVIGGSYTFGDGTNVICEYIYNGDGYNSEEWDEFTDFVKYNNNTYKSNSMFKGLAEGNLAEASEMMNFREMRRNYVFVRFSNSTLIEDIDSQLVFMVNLDDASFLTFPSIDYKAGENTVVGLSSTIFAGENDSEFGMSYWQNDITLTLKYYF